MSGDHDSSTPRIKPQDTSTKPITVSDGNWVGMEDITECVSTNPVHFLPGKVTHVAPV